MTEPAAATDVSDMYPVHQVFRDTLAAAPALLGTVAGDDTARRDLVANFYANILAFLDVHHHGEEELIFPLLLERCVGERALVETVAGQHRDVDGLVAESTAGLAAWSSGDPAARGAVAATLAALGERMAEHLDDEERLLLPLCAAAMTPEEFGALPGHAMASFSGDKVWLILGLIRARMTDQQRAAMLEHMPPPAVEMWTTVGERAYGELMAEVGPLGA